MKIAIEQAVGVAPARALAAYASPTFYENRPTRDDIEVRGVLRHEDGGAEALIEVRFAFTGSVSAAVRAVVDPARLSWVTRTVVVPAEGRAAWEVLPDHYADRLTASGSYRLRRARPRQRARGRARSSGWREICGCTCRSSAARSSGRW